MRVVSILVALALMVSLLTIPTSAAEEMRSWKLMKTLTLLPYKGFGSTTLSHFNEAFWQWNKECSTYSLQRSLTTHEDTDFYIIMNGTGGLPQNKIYKASRWNNSSPGVAHIACNTSSTEVVSASINLNPTQPLSNGADSNAYDVWTVIIHEAGHILGFGHSDRDSVMKVTPKGTINRYLSSYDRNRLNSKC